MTEIGKLFQPNSPAGVPLIQTVALFLPTKVTLKKDLSHFSDLIPLKIRIFSLFLMFANFFMMCCYLILLFGRKSMKGLMTTHLKTQNHKNFEFDLIRSIRSTGSSTVAICHR